MLDFRKKFNYNICRIPLDSRGCQWLVAVYRKSTCRTYLTTIIFIVQGTVSRLNKNPNAHSGCTEQQGYGYDMLKRRRKLAKEGYKFDPRTREGVRERPAKPKSNPQDFWSENQSLDDKKGS